VVGTGTTVTFKARPDEAVRASRLANRGLYRLMAITPIILFVTGLLVLALLGWDEASILVISVWAGALLLLVLDLSIPSISSRQVARRYPERFAIETVLAFDDTGMHAHAGATQVDRGWEAMTDYIENDEFILVRQGRLAVAVVPKRAFESTADLEEFRSLLRSHLRS